MDLRTGEMTTTVRSTVQGLVVETRLPITSWELDQPLPHLALAELLEPGRPRPRLPGQLPVDLTPAARLAAVYDHIVSRQTHDIEDTVAEMRRLTAFQVQARMCPPAEAKQ